MKFSKLHTPQYLLGLLFVFITFFNCLETEQSVYLEEEIEEVNELENEEITHFFFKSKSSNDGFGSLGLSNTDEKLFYTTPSYCIKTTLKYLNQILYKRQYFILYCCLKLDC